MSEADGGDDSKKFSAWYYLLFAAALVFAVSFGIGLYESINNNNYQKEQLVLASRNWRIYADKRWDFAIALECRSDFIAYRMSFDGKKFEKNPDNTNRFPSIQQALMKDGFLSKAMSSDVVKLSMGVATLEMGKESYRTLVNRVAGQAFFERRSLGRFKPIPTWLKKARPLAAVLPGYLFGRSAFSWTFPECGQQQHLTYIDEYRDVLPSVLLHAEIDRMRLTLEAIQEKRARTAEIVADACAGYSPLALRSSPLDIEGLGRCNEHILDAALDYLTALDNKLQMRRASIRASARHANANVDIAAFNRMAEEYEASAEYRTHTEFVRALTELLSVSESKLRTLQDDWLLVTIPIPAQDVSELLRLASIEVSSSPENDTVERVYNACKKIREFGVAMCQSFVYHDLKLTAAAESRLRKRQVDMGLDRLFGRSP